MYFLNLLWLFNFVIYTSAISLFPKENKSFYAYTKAEVLCFNSITSLKYYIKHKSVWWQQGKYYTFFSYQKVFTLNLRIR